MWLSLPSDQPPRKAGQRRRGQRISFRRQVTVVRLAHVNAAAALGCGVNAEGLSCTQIAAFGQILPKGSLHDGSKRKRRVLSPNIAIHSFCQVIGNGNSGSLHNYVVYH